MYTILVCDDEKDIVSALNIYLSAEGYRVLTAYDGYQALRLLDREEVHLILWHIDNVKCQSSCGFRSNSGEFPKFFDQLCDLITVIIHSLSLYLEWESSTHSS